MAEYIVHIVSLGIVGLGIVGLGVEATVAELMFSELINNDAQYRRRDSEHFVCPILATNKSPSVDEAILIIAKLDNLKSKISKIDSQYVEH